MSPPKPRDIRLDTLRGLLLVIMAAVHVPTPLSHALQEPFGFTSAAEGFVFLGASLAGLIYGKAYRQTGWGAMSRRVWNRSRQIDLMHLALVVPAALLAWAAGTRVTPLANHFHDFLVHPWGSLALWMDKWTLGPLRLLNFAAWALLLLALNPRLPSGPFSPLALLGRHSLTVFAIHVPLVIAAATTIEMLSPMKATQTVLGISVIALLFAWAALQEERKRERRAPATSAAATCATVGLPKPAVDGQTPLTDWAALSVTN